MSKSTQPPLYLLSPLHLPEKILKDNWTMNDVARCMARKYIRVSLPPRDTAGGANNAIRQEKRTGSAKPKDSTLGGRIHIQYHVRRSYDFTRTFGCSLSVSVSFRQCTCILRAVYWSLHRQLDRKPAIAFPTQHLWSISCSTSPRQISVDSFDSAEYSSPFASLDHLYIDQFPARSTATLSSNEQNSKRSSHRIIPFTVLRRIDGYQS